MAYSRLTAQPSIPDHDYSEILTVPDQTMSLKELMNRYALGEDILPYLGGRASYFDEDDEDFVHPSESGDYDISDAVNDLQTVDLRAPGIVDVTEHEEVTKPQVDPVDDK